MEIEIDILSGTVEVMPESAAAATAVAEPVSIAVPLASSLPDLAPSIMPEETASPGNGSSDAAAMLRGSGLLADIPDLILPSPGGVPPPYVPEAVAPISAPAPQPEFVAPPPAPPVFVPVAAAPAPVWTPPPPPAVVPPSVPETLPIAGDLIQEIRSRWQKTQVIDDEVMGTFHLGGSLPSQFALLHECLALLARVPEHEAERAAKELAKITRLPPLWIWSEIARLR